MHFAGEPGYILIDATSDDIKTRKVTFAEEQGDVESTYSTDTVSDITNIEKEMASKYVTESSPGHKINKRQLRVRSAKRGRKAKVEVERPKTPSPAASPRSNKIRFSARSETSTSSSRTDSISPQRRTRTKSNTSYSDDFGSDSSRSSSSSKSRSSSQERTCDNHIKHSKNPKLQQWLKEKNKEFRKLRREERKKKRAERKVKRKEMEEKEILRQKSDEAVKKWFYKKNKDVRLLKKRQQLSPGLDSSSTAMSETPSTVSNVTEEIISLENGEKMSCPQGLTETQPKKKKAVHRPLSAKFDYDKPAITRKQIRPKSSRPPKKKDPAEEEKDKENKKRASYDDWLKEKDKLNQQKNEEAKKNKAVEAAKSDSQTDEVISKVGKKRVDNILKGKKKIDTGIKKVDDKANAGYGKEKAEGDAEEAELTNKYKNMDDGETENGQSESKDSTKSSRSIFDVPPPRPSKSPAPPKDSIAEEQSGSDSPVPRPPSVTSSSPRPKLSAHRKIKQLKAEKESWDQFSQYVWDNLNEDEEDVLQRPEPQGSDQPDKVPLENAAEGESMKDEEKHDGKNGKQNCDQKEEVTEKLVLNNDSNVNKNENQDESKVKETKENGDNKTEVKTPHENGNNEAEVKTPQECGDIESEVKEPKNHKENKTEFQEHQRGHEAEVEQDENESQIQDINGEDNIIKDVDNKSDEKAEDPKKYEDRTSIDEKNSKGGDKVQTLEEAQVNEEQNKDSNKEQSTDIKLTSKENEIVNTAEDGQASGEQNEKESQILDRSGGDNMVSDVDNKLDETAEDPEQYKDITSTDVKNNEGGDQVQSAEDAQVNEEQNKDSNREQCTDIKRTSENEGVNTAEDGQASGEKVSNSHEKDEEGEVLKGTFLTSIDS